MPIGFPPILASNSAFPPIFQGFAPSHTKPFPAQTSGFPFPSNPHPAILSSVSIPAIILLYKAAQEAMSQCCFPSFLAVQCYVS